LSKTALVWNCSSAPHQARVAAAPVLTYCLVALAVTISH
jgi:hypothetical protein